MLMDVASCLLLWYITLHYTTLQYSTATCLMFAGGEKRREEKSGAERQVYCWRFVASHRHFVPSTTGLGLPPETFVIIPNRCIRRPNRAFFVVFSVCLPLPFVRLLSLPPPLWPRITKRWYDTAGTLRLHYGYITLQGVLVPVRVFRHNDAGVRVRLEGGPGLFGFVPRDYVTDDVLPTDPITGQVRCGVVVVCVCVCVCVLSLTWLPLVLLLEWMRYTSTSFCICCRPQGAQIWV